MSSMMPPWLQQPAQGPAPLPPWMQQPGMPSFAMGTPNPWDMQQAQSQGQHPLVSFNQPGTHPFYTGQQLNPWAVASAMGGPSSGSSSPFGGGGTR